MKKLLLIVIPVIILLIGALYFFFLKQNTAAPVTDPETNEPISFNPFRRNSVTPSEQGGITAGESTSITTQPVVNPAAQLPKLRRLSLTPVGGFAASSTASSSLVRYVDRGSGHIHQASDISNTIDKISNTTIPRVYESFWNRKADAGILRYMKDELGTVANFYGEIRALPRNASSTETSTIQYEVKGKFLANEIKEIAVSPKGDRIFTYNIENGAGVGYISGFDESKKTKVIDVPLTQVNIDWPEENTIALSTKASGGSTGFLYLIDLKKPVLRRMIGGITGLTAKVSPDAKRILYSSTVNNGFTTGIYNLADNSSQEIVFRTTTEKCIWSKKNPNELYCAVPSEYPQALYPDDWYRGNVSFIDQIWHLNTTTGEVHLVSNLLKEANDLIDVINLTLDPKEEYLYFMNKKDLTLWSLDLNK